MASVKGMKCFHCPECGREILIHKSMLKDHTMECCDVEMLKGGAPKEIKMLNPIKNSKRNR